MGARRALAVSVATVLALGLMIPTLLAAGVTSAADSFATPSYSGGSGWTTDWAESGDGSGTASGGVIRAVSSGCVDTSCVRFQSLLGVSGTYVIWRRTNIDGAIGATLSFSYNTNGLGTLSVATRSGPSDAWTEQSLLGSGSYTTYSMSIAAQASNATEVRFSLSSPLLLIAAASAYVDNVSITASYPTTTTSTTTTTTSTTIASTTSTTSGPILTVPTVTIPTVTIPTVTIPPAVTATTSTTVATTVPGSTTSTIAGSTTTTTGGAAAPGPGGPNPNLPGGTGPGFVLPPLSEAEAELASDNNITVDLATGEDFMTFGVNPLTNLGVKLNSTVEVITTEILSALALGAILAFFGVRRIEENEEIRS